MAANGVWRPGPGGRGSIEPGPGPPAAPEVPACGDQPGAGPGPAFRTGAACLGRTPRAVARGRLSASFSLWHHLLVDSDWDRFVSRCQQALGELVEGRPEPFKALWSHADDVVIMGAFGGYERGWQQVSARLDWAAKGIKSTDRSAENVLAVVNDDLAYTVDLEHMTRHAGDQLVPRTLRSTQVYRREGGEWKVVLRHADELPRKDEQQR